MQQTCRYLQELGYLWSRHFLPTKPPSLPWITQNKCSIILTSREPERKSNVSLFLCLPSTVHKIYCIRMPPSLPFSLNTFFGTCLHAFFAHHCHDDGNHYSNHCQVPVLRAKKHAKNVACRGSRDYTIMWYSTMKIIIVGCAKLLITGHTAGACNNDKVSDFR